MIILVLSLFILWTLLTPVSSHLERKSFKRWESNWRRDGTCHYNESGIRTVAPSGNNWEVIEQVSGDRDVLPLGEDHSRGAGCICSPRVDIVGPYLVVVHNSFDNREIVEEAIRIINEEARNG